MQTSIGSDRAGSQDGERGGQRKTDGFRKADERQKEVAMVRDR
jgi:hypothetical protein